ncbi:MAG: MFS transporter [Myxococcales bacterium]|nr:MFS transporter [Myxococcales bacterium]
MEPAPGVVSAGGGPGREARLVTPALVLVTVTLFLGAQVPNVFVLAPRFLADRGHTEDQLGVIMGGFNLASLVMSPVVGWLCLRLGHARVLAAGCLVSAVGAVGFALADELVGFTAGRALQGLGFAAVLVGAAAYVAETAPPARLGEALGLAGVLTLAAQAVGPVAAAVLRDLAGWSAVWWFGAGAGVAGAAVALALPPAVRHGAVDDGPRGAAFGPLAASVLAGVGFGAIWTFLADHGPRAGVGQVTPFFVAYVIAAISVRLFLGTLSDRIGRRQAATPALCGHAAILVAMAAVGATWHLVPIGLVYGFCHGIYYPTLQAMVVERSGGRRSRAISASTFAFGAGVAAAAFALGPVAHAFGYPVIYLVAAGCGALAAALVWWR